MMLFGKKYTKRTDGLVWNRSTLVRMLIEEAGNPSVAFTKNTITFTTNPKVKIVFITNQYSDSNILEVNGSVFFITADEDLFWVDLLSLAKIKYGGKHRTLRIYKDQVWEGSAVEAEAKSFYRALFAVFSDMHITQKFLRGEVVTAEGEQIAIPNTKEYLWLQDSALEMCKRVYSQD